MKLRFRVLYLLLSGFWKKPIGFLEQATLRLSVLPNDIDIQRMTNDRYFAFMDLGRFDFMRRLGLLRKAFLVKKWVPLILFQTIHYRYPIGLFQKIELKTRVLWWDEYDFWIEQVFMRKNRILATGYVQGAWFGKKGRISSTEFFDLIKMEYSTPHPPANLGPFLDASRQIVSGAKRKSQEPSSVLQL
ncbi:hypothetical protein CH373_12520 [Leptospira perolatii]|uniref:Thioesterase n=1 Tax=Leptospira perolatii TaxID=2023191 RepID=A0A2M9ZLC7_9LEPT|nr:thioesterase family protein [Leptospira perolatii]PJZ70240.1 hypothetical protein CH360_06450 [Leptospira perolatii]PJZ72876.1 hypothetical protein CH373_12520 [Leptospira perolatii]